MTRRPDPPSTLSGVLRVFDLSIGEMLWSRRTIFMALVVGSPVVLALVARLVQAIGVAPLRVNGVQTDASGVFGTIIWGLFITFIVPVLGVFYGTALIADEVEDRTITYLFTRPVRRGAVLLGKYLAYVVCTTLVVLPSVVLVYLLIVPFGQMAGTFGWLLIDLGLLALGLAAYGGLFAFVGAVMRRPLVGGLVFALGWEPVALFIGGYLREFTIAYHMQSLVPHAAPSDSVVSLLQAAVFDTPPPAAVSLLWLVAGTAVFLALAARAVERREYVLQQ